VKTMPRILPSLVVLTSLAALAGCSAEAPLKPGQEKQQPKGNDNDENDEQDDEDEGRGKQASAATGAQSPATPARTPTTPQNTCETAREFGSVIGDLAGDPATTEGRCTEWVRVRVLEQDDGWFGTAVKLKATLTPPAGALFDLSAFVNLDSDLNECRTPTGNARRMSGGVEIDLGWGEGFLANSVDDSRTLTLQIRSTTGQCSEQPWRLTITQQP
jgi:hypothetical protein